LTRPVRYHPSVRNYTLTKNIDNTNARHLELYTILGEYDNAGFPLSYCLLSTATSVEVRKRTKALQAWAAVLHREYGVTPRFVHTDKDMAEIGASRRVWPGAKHQLCWWHQREAVRRRLKGNLPTSAYNAQRAANEYTFVDVSFRPYGRLDPSDSEGGVPGEIGEEEENEETIIPLTTAGEDPNSIKIRIRRNPLDAAPLSADARECTGVPALPDSSPGSPETPARSANVTKLTIRIPAPSMIHDSGLVTEDEPEPDEDMTIGRRTFCPLELRDTVIGMMERHFCAHPLIPGYSAPSPEGIKAWAVKQIYELCVQNDLPNLWAYLWENWYRCGRWELWARSGNPVEIPRLKTTMLVEGQ
jgi:hypothetical protein